jgi:hypothetical protein
MTTIRTAYELLIAMRGCGFTLNLNGDMLEVKQKRWIDDDLEDLIRTNKTDLIKLLESEVKQ